MPQFYPTVTTSLAGQTPSGSPIHRYVLNNTKGLEVEVLSLGGTISKIITPDRHGERADIALGYDDVAAYIPNPGFLGSVVGPVAGRMAGAAFRIGGETYSLPANDGLNHLHGGTARIDQQVWCVEILPPQTDRVGIRLHYRHPDGRGGYPGNVDYKVTYELNTSDELVFRWRAEADRETPASLTQHTYFNLSGAGSGSIEDHIVQVHASEYWPTRDDLSLRDETLSVEGTASDLREPKQLRDALTGIPRQHGDFYRLVTNPQAEHELRNIATVTDPATGRRLDVATTHSGVQFYTSVHMDGTICGKGGDYYEPFAGFCLECQEHPDAVTLPHWGNILVGPESPIEHTTVYRFSAS